MSAVAPLTIRALIRPVYRRTDLLGFPRDWVRENGSLLLDWFEQCSACGCENERAVSFEDFAMCQHDMQLTLRDEYRRTYRGP